MGRTLNRNLKRERAFPLVLVSNYNEVIRPRGELLKDKVPNFELEKAFFHSDYKFCKHWGISMDELRAAKRKREKKIKKTEKEVLWKYIPQF